MLSTSWRNKPVANLSEHMIARSLRRYRVDQSSSEPVTKAISEAWHLLTTSIYTQDVGIGDDSGITHLKAGSNGFDKGKPNAILCSEYAAWVKLLRVADDVDPERTKEPFRYDVVNLGREVLAQAIAPVSIAFSEAINQYPINSSTVASVGATFVEFLHDVDRLVATDQAFLLGSWIEMARRSGAENATDCGKNAWGIQDCADFYEWNARTQITTWNPTSASAAKIPAGPIDYASKHWAGLIRDYYAERVRLSIDQALHDSNAGHALNTSAMDLKYAQLAYNWTTSTSKYSTTPIGDYVVVSREMLQKYGKAYAQC